MSLQNIQSVFKRSCISISNVFSVSACNTLTTAPIVKNFVGELNAIFLKKTVSFPNFEFLLI